MLLILKKLTIFIIISIMTFAGYELSQPNPRQTAVNLVASKVLPHSMDVHSKDLRTSPNPNGDGIFVYAKKRDSRGIERKALWLVFEKEIFPLNSTAKEITPQQKWPDEIMPMDWSMTGLNLYSYHKPMQWVFG